MTSHRMICFDWVNTMIDSNWIGVNPRLELLLRSKFMQNFPILDKRLRTVRRVTLNRASTRGFIGEHVNWSVMRCGVC